MGDGIHMAHTEAYEGLFHGEQAVWLKAGRYTAAILPEIGGNLIAFRDTEANYTFLREPGEEEMDSFKANPGIHGIPVLFPPNRYEDGEFPWNGKVYQFPVNEAATGNHLHGFLHTTPWAVEQFGVNGEESFVTVALHVNEAHAIYQYLPFSFTFKLTYRLSATDGLTQEVFIRNTGKDSMPCLLAFHTAVNAPFATGSVARDYRVKLTLGERWELNERMLPTGAFQPLTADEKLMQGEGVYPFFASMDNHYTALPQNGRSRMELTDTRLNVKLVYDVGNSYKQWMIWNNGATEGFFCPEPQINLVNAPKAGLPAEQVGLFSLEPGEIWQELSRLYVIG